VALRPLFTSNFIFGAFGGRLFENKPDALTHLMSQVQWG
jgi:hypothetical protein